MENAARRHTDITSAATCQITRAFHTASNGTFSRFANGVRAINGLPAFTPTPLALGLNVESTHSTPQGA